MAHTYIIGQSGSGKSTLSKTLALEAIKDGHAVVFIDPHGADVADLIERTPASRLADTILFDPSSTDYSFQWNPLAEGHNLPLTATILADTIKDAWGYHGMTTPVMDMYLYFTVATLLRTGGTLSDSLSLLSDKSYRDGLNITDTVLRQFWSGFDAMTSKEQRDATRSTLNKLYTLFADPRIRHIFSTSKGLFRMSDMVKDKILFVRLSQGELGMSKVALIGSILLSQIHLASLSRDPSKPLHIFIDEVHTFTPSAIAEMLSGLRKFNVSITVAHQYIDQLDRKLFSSLMGNCSDRFVFNISREDAARFQDRSGTYGAYSNLDELPPYEYRNFSFSSRPKDFYTEPLGVPSARDMSERIWQQSKRNYYRPVNMDI